MKFQVGDRVREGMRVGTITDVGTMLIEVKTEQGQVAGRVPMGTSEIAAHMRGSGPTSGSGRRISASGEILRN